MKVRASGAAMVAAMCLAAQLAALAAVVPKDQKFAKEAAMGGMAEVMLGQMAAKKATDAEAKQFGEMMVQDHSKANEELKQLAAKKGIKLPSAVGPEHKATAARLSKLSGAAFDKAYMGDMVQDHVKDVKEFQMAAKSCKDPELKAWAAKTLPTLEMHLKSAKGITAKLKVTVGGSRWLDRMNKRGGMRSGGWVNRTRSQ